MGGEATGGRRCSLDEGETIAALVKSFLADVADVHVAGSVRRGVEEVGDVDLVVVPKDLPALEARMGAFWKKDVSGKVRMTGIVNGVQVDLLLTDVGGLGAALMHFTGPKELNIRQRFVAKKKGYLLNEKGLFKNGVRLPCSSSEREIYDTLGFTWKEPEAR